jgi:5'-phosphate synthase pdxT subunit
VGGGEYDEPTPFPGIFIRAPLFREVKGSSVEVLARLPDGGVVAVRQGRILATAFHPELTGDDRFHRYFLRLARREVPRP